MSTRRLALAVGDPNGIGPEIALKAVQALQGEQGLHLTLYGPPGVLERTAQQLGLIDLLERVARVATPEPSPSASRPGLVHAEAGASAVAAATAALQACRAGRHDAVAAGPHHEGAVARAGVAFSGYPSLVARVCGLREDEVFLMLVGAGLRIVHVTLHESVASALARITPQRVAAAARAGLRACRLLGVPQPAVGVFGLNPHASEGGLFGPEDEALVAPAVATLRAEGHQVDGPEGADAMLARRAHDLYVAMLHDQGHIPVKLLAPQAASALSIGADVLLSSVGHGCAMDIAGRGVARPDAMIRTLRLLAGLTQPGAPTESPS